MQIYTSDRVGDYIMQGASQFGASVGGGLANMADAFAKAQEKKKQLAAQGKAADALVKSSPELLNSLGMTPEDWALQSPTDKHAAIQGAMGAQAFAEGARAGEERTKRMLEMERRLEAQEAEAANRGRAGSFFGEMGRLMKPQAPEPGAEGPTMPGLDAFSAIGEASKSSGFQMPPQTVDDFLKEGLRKEAGGAASFFSPDQVGRGIPVTLPDGTTVPGAFVTPLGPNSSTTVTDPTLRQKPTPEVTGKLRPVVDPNTGKAVPGFGMDENGKIHDFRTQMEKGGLPDPEPPQPGFFNRIFGGGNSKSNTPTAAPTVGRWNPATGKLELTR